jgi:putative ABC transport system permease protein
MKIFRPIKVSLFMSFKFIVRGNFGVSLLTICMLILIFIDILFVPSLIGGVVAQLNKQLVNGLSSNISITPKSNTDPITNATSFMNQIQKNNHVKAVTSRIAAGTKITFNDASVITAVSAIDTNTDPKVFETSHHIISGSYLSSKDTDGILLGVQLAGMNRKDLTFYNTSLKTVDVGDSVSVTLVNGVQKNFIVKGIYQDDFVLADNQAFITQHELQTLIPATKDTASTIYVRTKQTGNEAKIVNELSTIRTNVVMDTWESLKGIIKDQIDSFNLVDDILWAVSLFVAAITIFIITYTDLVNKRKQIGIERAIGISLETIVLTYLLKAIYYSIIGISLGILIYLYILVPFTIGHPFMFPDGPVSLIIDPYLISQDAYLLIIVATMSAFIPTALTLHMSILDAIWSI